MLKKAARACCTTDMLMAARGRPTGAAGVQYLQRRAEQRGHAPNDQLLLVYTHQDAWRH